MSITDHIKSILLVAYGIGAFIVAVLLGRI